MRLAPGRCRCRIGAPCRAYAPPAALTGDRSQSGSAYRVRRSPSLSVTTVGRQRACQAARASASAFCCAGVSDGARRMTPSPLTLKSVDWLGVSGRPARMASALASASAARAFAAAAAAAALPWSISKDGGEGGETGAGEATAAGEAADAAGASGAGAASSVCGPGSVDSRWADAVERLAAINSKTAGTTCMLQAPKGVASGLLLSGEG